MFLLRTVFWLVIVIMILPADTSSLSVRDAPNPIEASTLAPDISEAPGTPQDDAGLCGRQPKLCAVGGLVWDLFLLKAEYGIDLVHNAFIGRKDPASELTPRQPAQRDTAGDAGQHPVATPNTLTIDDLLHQWRGPSA